IDEFGQVERSKLPDPVDVPEWMQQWLDANVSIEPVSDLKAWIREAVIAGAVRVETPDVPEDVLADARWAASGVFSGKVCRLADWVLEQVGETDG
ncbi:MAG: hypothetical protein GY701_11865, partial [Sulfitobacter sp.]|nr:hypothetical protein [Sulfitobacter sp.]